MEKEYKEMKFLPGSTIDEAINEMLLRKEQGELVCARFNGVMLYSDTVTVDSAYEKITGLTKTEFINLKTRY